MTLILSLTLIALSASGFEIHPSTICSMAPNRAGSMSPLRIALMILSLSLSITHRLDHSMSKACEATGKQLLRLSIKDVDPFDIDGHIAHVL